MPFALMIKTLKKMKAKSFILFGTVLLICGNVFAYSPYADTITNNLQKKSFLSVASFPTTAADATFVERVETKVIGYEPYFNKSAFADLPIKEQEELENMINRSEIDRRQKSRDELVQKINDAFSQQDSNSHKYTGGNYMRAALTPENISKYNLATHNGGCTPPESDNFWPNKIFTSGAYMYTAPAFEKFMITAFRKEGECGQDRDGWSCYGCYSKGLCAGIDMKTVTRSMVENLTYNKMYLAENIDKLPDAFRGYAMWGIWGSGQVTGTKIFQRALKVAETGKIDDATIRAAETYDGDFADAYVREHERFYRNLVVKDSNLNKYLDGWLKSLKLLRPSGCHIVPTKPIYR